MDQFIGRIGPIERLSERLGEADLMTVAAAMLPEGDARTHAKLVIYADISKKHLASIEAIVKRARWRAARDGRDKATVADVDTAVNSPVTTPLSQMNPNAEVGAGSARGPPIVFGMAEA